MTDTNSSNLIELRLAGGAQGFNWLPVFVADEQGLFEAQGIRIVYKRMGSVDKATTAVLEGEADLAITPPEGAVANFVGGGALRIIAGNAVRLPMSLVARPGIQSIVELKGKKIGTSSLTEGTAIYTQIMLAAEGLHNPGDYDFVLAGIHTKRWEALQSGEIDCAPQPAPWNFLAKDKGFSLIGEVSAAVPEILFTGIIGMNGWLSANTDLVGRFLCALNLAHSLINEKAIEEIMMPIFERITTPGEPLLARRGLDYMREMGMWPVGQTISSTALGTTIDLMIKAQLLDEAKRSQAYGVFDRSYLRQIA